MHIRLVCRGLRFSLRQVKGAMKRNPKSARVLQRILNARQFCLKLIANVTYGYTAAGFSGRMPMAELADSIVQARLAFFASSRQRDAEPHLGVPFMQ